MSLATSALSTQDSLTQSYHNERYEDVMLVNVAALVSITATLPPALQALAPSAVVNGPSEATDAAPLWKQRLSAALAPPAMAVREGATMSKPPAHA